MTKKRKEKKRQKKKRNLNDQKKERRDKEEKEREKKEMIRHLLWSVSWGRGFSIPLGQIEKVEIDESYTLIYIFSGKASVSDQD